jgi:hypothetical protein
MERREGGSQGFGQRSRQALRAEGLVVGNEGRISGEEGRMSRDKTVHEGG